MMSPAVRFDIWRTDRRGVVLAWQLGMAATMKDASFPRGFTSFVWWTEGARKLRASSISDDGD
jgi:hypothetical protein